jgi:hypothetical protein
MARLNRENTFIENNQYPLAGLHPPDVEVKFAEILKPLETDILQLEAALLLHNIPLFAVFAGYLIGFFVLSILLTKSIISPLTYSFIFVPLFHLVYLFGGIDFGRTLYLAEIPNLPADRRDRVRSVPELLHWFAPTLKWGWRFGFFIYRTFVCPNIVDTIVLILAAILLGFIAKLINPLVLLLALIVIALFVPAILTKTPAGQFLEQLAEDRKKKAEAAQEAKSVAPEAKETAPEPKAPAPEPAAEQKPE